MNRCACLLTILSGLALLSDARANDGEYLGLRYQIDVTSGQDYGIGMRIQPDGKLLLVGSCYTPDALFCAARLNPDATYDTTFGAANLGYEAIVDNGIPQTAASAFALMPDGRAVIVGTALGSNFSVGIIARLQPNGQLAGWSTVHLTNADPPYPAVNAIAVQPDGKVVVVGSANRDSSGNVDFGIARLDDDFLDDPTFNGEEPKLVAFDLNGPSGPANDAAVAVAIQRDGKILVGGNSDAPGNTTQPTLTRLMPDGSMDMSFGIGGRAVQSWGLFGVLNAMTVDRDGTILLAGYGFETLTDDAPAEFVVSRLSPDGSLDPYFGKCFLPVCVPGPVFIDFPYYPNGYSVANALTIQSNGKILIAGETQRSVSGNYFAIARVDQNGNLDPSFGAGGLSVGIIGPEPGVNDYINSIQVGNGGIMISGRTYDAAEGKYRFSTGRVSLDLIFSSQFETRR